AGGVIFIVMELVEGKRLSELIADRPLPVDEAVNIAAQVAEGLARAHQSRIVHRDLKPDNVIVGADGRARILDFGLARILEEAERPALLDRSREEAITEDLSLAGRLLGTAAYMSPEQARGDAADARSDVFSFGVTLYEMLGGRRPFGGSTLTATLAKILESEPEPLNSLRGDLPGELGLIVHRCLRKPVADRFGDASELALALRRLRETPGALHAPPVAPSATTIAVFPFSVRGSQEYGYLREGMVDLLSTKLDGAGELRSVDPHVILGCAAAQAVAAGDPSQAVAIAHRCGAGRFVLGNVLEVGGQLHVDASLYRASKELKLEAKVAVRGEASRIFEMVDQLTSELLASRPGGPGARLTRIAGMTTSSFPALKAYLEGEAEMRATRRVPAAEAYRRAVTADPAFALAWYRLSVAALWSGQSALADEAAQRAVEHASRLSDRDRHLLEAFEASLRGDNDEAERRYRTILGAHPDDVEAWYQLGELQFHCGPQRGQPIEHSREVWERVLSLDPRHASAMMHLTVIEGSAGNRERLESLVRHAMDLYPSGDAGVWGRAYWSFLQDDRALQEEVVDELRRSSDYVVTYAAWFVGAYLGHHAGAIRIGALLTEPVRSPQVR
ncbi:MAG: protein kinase domain-containing protein, partial [Candidatus Rokuibacteriota bacterium]